LEFVGFFEHIISVDCFAANFKIVLGEIGANGFPKKAAIVGDQDPVGHFGLTTTPRKP
jgi:hypothetical protein